MKLFSAAETDHNRADYWKFFAHHTPIAAAASLQSCPTLCDPIDGSPSGSSAKAVSALRVPAESHESSRAGLAALSLLSSCLALQGPRVSSC